MQTTHRLITLALGALVALGAAWDMQAQEAPNGIASAEPVEIGAAEVTPRTLGDTREDLVFTPLFRACRMADTRVEGGPIAAGTSRDFKGVGNLTQQGGAAICGVPSNASAVVMNVASIHVRRDSRSSIAYSEELISATMSATLQSTDRHHGIVGQECCHFQLDL